VVKLQFYFGPFKFGRGCYEVSDKNEPLLPPTLDFGDNGGNNKSLHPFPSPLEKGRPRGICGYLIFKSPFFCGGGDKKTKDEIPARWPE